MGYPRLLTTAFIVLTFSSAAGAYCIEPSIRLNVPDVPTSYDRPDVPYCLSEYSYSQKHTCDQWELDGYFDEVEEYVEALNTYLSETNDLVRKIKRYSTEAYDYAQCEAEEVKSQHE